CYVKLERVVKLVELTGMYGDEKPTVPQVEPTQPRNLTATPAPAATPAPSQSPADIARANLLARLKAAKSMSER
ncbi:MAG: hypothetical protein ACRCZF_11430, partial [Gemmataceae bacterium]